MHLAFRIADPANRGLAGPRGFLADLSEGFPRVGGASRIPSGRHPVVDEFLTTFRRGPEGVPLGVEGGRLTSGSDPGAAPR